MGVRGRAAARALLGSAPGSAPGWLRAGLAAGRAGLGWTGACPVAEAAAAR